MTPHPVRILVENRMDQLVVEGILRRVIGEGSVSVRVCWEVGTMISMADRVLLESPQTPVVLVVNGKGLAPEEIQREIVGPASRRLAMTSDTGWLVVAAMPDILAWATSDERVAESFEREQLANPYDRAVRFSEWARSNNFDRRRLERSDPEFRRLMRFLESEIDASESRAQTADAS